MSRATPEFVEVFKLNQLTNFPSDVLYTYAEAQKAVSEGRAKWVHRRKIVLVKPVATDPRRGLRAGSFECNQRLVDEALGAKKFKRNQAVA
jgi:hypothetical protein